jgi:hypothetical protein
MDDSLYDEFGNYIGGDLPSDDEEEYQQSPPPRAAGSDNEDEAWMDQPKDGDVGQMELQGVYSIPILDQTFLDYCPFPFHTTFLYLVC